MSALHQHRRSIASTVGCLVAVAVLLVLALLAGLMLRLLWAAFALGLGS